MMRQLERILFPLSLAGLAFGWMGVEAGPFQLRPVLPLMGSYLVVALLTGSLLRGLNSLLNSRIVLLFFFSYGLLLMSQLVSAFVHGLPDGALPNVARGLCYMLLGLLYAAGVHQMLLDPRATTLIRRGCEAGTFGFVIVFAGIFALQGKNIFAMYLADLASGNKDGLMYNYYSVLFSSVAEDTKMSFRNTFLTCLVLYFALLGSVAPLTERGWPRWTCRLAMGLSVFFIVTSVSRVNILLTLLVIAFVWAGSVLTHRRRASNAMVLYGIVVTFVVGAVSLLSISGNRIPQLLTDRFGAEIVEDGRISMYGTVLSDTSDYWLWGHGYAAMLPGERAERVHHFALGAYFENGLVGLIPSLLMFGVLVALSFQAAWRLLRNKSIELPVLTPWLAGLITFALLRLNIAATVGQIAIADWVALAFVIAAATHLEQQTEVSD